MNFKERIANFFDWVLMLLITGILAFIFYTVIPQIL